MEKAAKTGPDGSKKAQWEKPEISSFEMNLSDVKTGYAPGSDGSLPGPPDTSLS